MIYIAFIIFTLLWAATVKTSPYRNAEERSLSLMMICPIMFVAILIMGLRNITVGVDTGNYYTLFESYRNSSFELAMADRYEPFWTMCTWSISRISGSYLFYQILFASVYCLLASRFLIISIRYYKVISITTVIVVFITSAYLIAFNASRQMLAAMIIANSINSLMLSRNREAILLWVMALGIHYTAILSIPMLIFWKFRSSRWIKWGSTLSMSLIFFGFTYLLPALLQLGVWQRYLSNAMNHFQEANLSKWIWLIVTLHAFYIFIRNKRFGGGEVFVALCSLTWVFTNLLSPILNYSERIGLYYIPFIALIYPIVGKTIRNINLRFVYFFIVTGIYAIWFVMASRTPQHSYSIYFTLT